MEAALEVDIARIETRETSEEAFSIVVNVDGIEECEVTVCPSQVICDVL